MSTPYAATSSPIASFTRFTDSGWRRTITSAPDSNQRHCGQRFPMDGACFPIAPSLRHAFANLDSFVFQASKPGVTIIGNCVIASPEARQASIVPSQNIHIRCHSRARRWSGPSGCGRRQAHVGDQDDQLFGKVNIHRRARFHEMTVCHGGGNDCAVVFILADTQDKFFAFGSLRHRTSSSLSFSACPGPQTMSGRPLAPSTDLTALTASSLNRRA